MTPLRFHMQVVQSHYLNTDVRLSALAIHHYAVGGAGTPEQAVPGYAEAQAKQLRRWQQIQAIARKMERNGEAPGPDFVALMKFINYVD